MIELLTLGDLAHDVKREPAIEPLSCAARRDTVPAVG